jgi:hypothetical protein
VPETPECTQCGLLLTPEDVLKSDQHLLCPECYADTAQFWAAWRLERQPPEVGE